MDGGATVGSSPWDRKELDTTDLFHWFTGRSISLPQGDELLCLFKVVSRVSPQILSHLSNAACRTQDLHWLTGNALGTSMLYTCWSGFPKAVAMSHPPKEPN